MDGMTNADAVNCTKEAAIVAQMQCILLLKLHPCTSTEQNPIGTRNNVNDQSINVSHLVSESKWSFVSVSLAGFIFSVSR